MERAKKYLNTFITMSVLAGAFYALGMSFVIGIWNGLMAGIMFGAGVGVCMAVIIIPIDYLLTRNLPPEALSVRQNREVEINGNFESIFEKSLDVLRNYKSVQKVASLKEKHMILGRTKTTCLTFSQKIELRFTILSQNIIKIHVSSHPASKYTLIDYGTNFKNVEYIKGKLQALSLS